MTKTIINTTHSVIDQVKNIWFVLAAACGITYWVAKHDSSLPDIQESKMRIGRMEKHVIVLESNFGKVQTQIDGIREDLTLIKKAVLK